jgi:shikimate dehydrogenase
MADPAPRAFVIGFPIGHSRSPLIHGFWLRQYGIAGSYEAVEVRPEGLTAFLTELREAGFAGGNVTIPHKEATFDFVGRRDAAAEEIGAVNTLWFEDDILCGGNTDAFGFAANLDDCAPGWDKARCALVLGAGGASRAVIHALKSRGFDDIRIVNRTFSRAAELVARFGAGVSAHRWDAADELAADAGLIVNSTSLGMSGRGDLDLDLSMVRDDAVATDLIYVPLETPLLRKARERGLRTVDGLGMLLHQAAPGFARWFGVTPSVTAKLRDFILADIRSPAEKRR